MKRLTSARHYQREVKTRSRWESGRSACSWPASWTRFGNTVLSLIASVPSEQTNAELPPIDGGEDAFDLKRHLISAKELALQIFLTGNSSLSHGSHIARFRCCMRPVVLAKLGWQHQLRSALLMADFLHFKSGGARKVLFVDGEMTISDLQTRLCGMSHNAPANLSYLPSKICSEQVAL